MLRFGYAVKLDSWEEWAGLYSGSRTQVGYRWSFWETNPSTGKVQYRDRWGKVCNRGESNASDPIFGGDFRTGCAEDLKKAQRAMKRSMKYYQKKARKYQLRFNTFSASGGFYEFPESKR